MQPEHLMLDSYAMFKAEDGFINITMLDERVMSDLLVKAMEGTGHQLYGINRTQGDSKVTLTFVTNEHHGRLHEAHQHACRNSMGGIIPKELTQILGKMAELNGGNVAVESLSKTVTVPHEPEQEQ